MFYISLKYAKTVLHNNDITVILPVQLVLCDTIAALPISTTLSTSKI